jgi:ATP-dependent Clp protease ATP-binding subunit ClpB
MCGPASDLALWLPLCTQVRTHFRPEFINRIDEFIIFDALGQEQIAQIVRLQVDLGAQLTCSSLRHLCSACVVLSMPRCIRQGWVH